MDQIMPEAGLDMVACLERVRQSDEEAARALVRELYPLVMKIVRSHLARRTDEEGPAQMVFAKIFAHLEQYSGTVPLEHWVSRVAVNTCLNQLRSEKCRPELRWADLNQDEAETLEKVGGAGERARSLRTPGRARTGAHNVGKPFRPKTA